MSRASADAQSDEGIKERGVMEEGSTSLKEVYALKEKDLNEVRKRLSEAVSKTDGHKPMKQILIQTVSHPGKLIRPLLVLLSAEGYPDQRREELLSAATAAELLHVASLLHDDIIDSAAFRRGYPAVQARYGVPAALCAGDYLMIRSFSYLSESGYHETADDLMKAALRVCDGELLQDMHQFDTFVNEEVYLESIRGKTAAVFAECCATGCKIAGYPEQMREAMRSYGELLGMVFQIRDDILDWTKEESDLQKPVNEDFRNGIYTLPSIYTFAKETAGEELRGYTNGRQLSDRDMEEIRAIVSECGGIMYAKGVMDKLAQKALSVLDSISMNEYCSVFRKLVRSIQHSL